MKKLLLIDNYDSFTYNLVHYFAALGAVVEVVRNDALPVRDIVGRVWIYVMLGIAVGAGIHGFVPENFMASIMGRDAWWSVPLAVRAEGCGHLP